MQASRELGVQDQTDAYRALKGWGRMKGASVLEAQGHIDGYQSFRGWGQVEVLLRAEGSGSDRWLLSIQRAGPSGSALEG